MDNFFASLPLLAAILIIGGITFFIFKVVQAKEIAKKVKAKEELDIKTAEEYLKKIEIEKEKLRLLEKLKQENTVYLLSIIEDINGLVNAFDVLLHPSSAFVSGYKLFMWKQSFFTEKFDINKITTYDISNLSEEIKTTFSRYLDIKRNYKRQINKFNSEYLEKELSNNNIFFSNIDGKSLDPQQRNALISDEDNTLVVAGAGSGKTATIAGKVAYLVHKKNICPQDILLISFTRKSSDEMKDRIKKKMKIDVAVKTFNKFGLDIIKQVDLENQKSVCGLSDNELKQLFQSFFESQLLHPIYLSKFNSFFLSESKPYKSPDQFTTARESGEYLRSTNPVGFKKITKIDLHGNQYSYREKLKSLEEVEIANFLFFNRIEYIYENGYEVRTASERFGQYKPDFFLPDYGIYIEHFGIDRKGNVPLWFKGDDYQSAKDKYNEGIKWKRQIHKENGTTLVETYSYQRKERNLLQVLEKKLKDLGVIFDPFTEDEKLELIKTEDKFALNEFVKLLITFTNLFKSNRFDIKRFQQDIEKNNDLRTLEFFALFTPIFHSYQDFLESRHEIDFTDMINIATDHVQTNKFLQTYKYIIIDEFQDISIGRYNLIKALLDFNPATKLFCVGDDWQSIYRFSGSDISIFNSFEKYFTKSPIPNYERQSCRYNIEKTYRFKKDLISVTSEFILKNKSQLKKELQAVKPKSELQSLNLITISDGYTISDSVLNILHKLKEELIARSENIENKEIIFLGRYMHDLDKILHNSSYIKLQSRTTEKVMLSVSEVRNEPIQFLTVHSSKGLEADYVFILNVNGGKYGFPSQVSDDPVLHYLLSHSDEYPNSEERRLFYVALTRCREQVFLFSDENNQSIFFKEISSLDPAQKSCPWCEIGNLIVKDGRFGKFYSCDNSGFCNYTEKISPNDLYTLAISYMKQKDYSKALPFLLQCEEKNKNYENTLRNIGFCYKALKDERNSMIYFEKAINTNNDTQSRYERITRSIKNGQLKFNFEDLSECIKFNYHKNDCYFLRALIHKKNKNFNCAIEDCEILVKANFALKNVFFILGECYENINNYDLAISYFEKAFAAGNQLAENKIEIVRRAILQELDKTIIAAHPKSVAPRVHSKEYNQQMIENAIKAKILISFNYQKIHDFSNEHFSLRTILPTEITFEGASNSPYVRGFCYLREADRTFAIDRISNLIINPNEITFSE